jgi:uncharacterized protein YkwD
MAGAPLALHQAVAQQPVESYLSAPEQAVLEELNHARTDPSGFAAYLEQLRSNFHGNKLERPGMPTLVTKEGVTAVDEAIRFLRNAEPVSALQPSHGLSLAAQAHVKDQQDGAMGHKGSDGSEPWDRMNRYGTWHGEVAENISYGGYTSRGVVMQLIIDDGVPDRGHRTNMFNPAFHSVGIACGPHPRYHEMCVMDFAAGYTERFDP